LRERKAENMRKGVDLRGEMLAGRQIGGLLNK